MDMYLFQYQWLAKALLSPLAPSPCGEVLPSCSHCSWSRCWNFVSAALCHARPELPSSPQRALKQLLRGRSASYPGASRPPDCHAQVPALPARALEWRASQALEPEPSVFISPLRSLGRWWNCLSPPLLPLARASRRWRARRAHFGCRELARSLCPRSFRSDRGTFHRSWVTIGAGGLGPRGRPRKSFQAQQL